MTFISGGPTEYITVAYVNDDIAHEIIEAGAPFWLLGDPDKNRESEYGVSKALAAPNPHNLMRDLLLEYPEGLPVYLLCVAMQEQGIPKDQCSAVIRAALDKGTG